MKLIKTDRKTVELDIVYTIKYDESKIELRDLLTDVLFTHNISFNKKMLFNERKNYLYGLKINESFHKLNGYHQIKVRYTFANPKYISDTLYESELIDFIKETTFNRTYINEAEFNKLKNQLTGLLKEQSNSIITVGRKLVEENLYKNKEDRVIKRYENMEKITYEEVLDELALLNKEAYLNMFIYGDLDNSNIINELSSLSNLPKLDKHEKPIYKKELKSVDTIRVTNDKFTQSFVSLVYELPHKEDLFHHQRLIPLFNEILSNSSGSYLYTEIREKKQYCYMTGAVAHNSILEIIGVINNSKIEEFINDVKLLINVLKEKLQYRNFSESKENLLTFRLNVLTNPEYQLIVYERRHFYNSIYEKDELIKLYNKVTNKDINEIFNSLKLKGIVIMEGRDEA